MSNRPAIQPHELSPAILAEDRSDLPYALDDMLRRLKALAPRLQSEGITSLSLFGSYARGDADAYSDIDICVEHTADVGLLDLIRIQKMIEQEFNLHVDLITPGGIKPTLRTDVEGSQIVVF